jgi:hypothetical protein
MTNDLPIGWLKEELDATKADIENMSKREKENLQNTMSNFSELLEKMKDEND